MLYVIVAMGGFFVGFAGGILLCTQTYLNGGGNGTSRKPGEAVEQEVSARASGVSGRGGNFDEGAHPRIYRERGRHGLPGRIASPWSRKIGLR